MKSQCIHVLIAQICFFENSRASEFEASFSRWHCKGLFTVLMCCWMWFSKPVTAEKCYATSTACVCQICMAKCCAIFAHKCFWLTLCWPDSNQQPFATFWSVNILGSGSLTILFVKSSNCEVVCWHAFWLFVAMFFRNIVCNTPALCISRALCGHLTLFWAICEKKKEKEKKKKRKRKEKHFAPLEKKKGFNQEKDLFGPWEKCNLLCAGVQILKHFGKSVAQHWKQFFFFFFFFTVVTPTNFGFAAFVISCLRTSPDGSTKTIRCKIVVQNLRDRHDIQEYSSQAWSRNVWTRIHTEMRLPVGLGRFPGLSHVWCGFIARCELIWHQQPW